MAVPVRAAARERCAGAGGVHAAARRRAPPRRGGHGVRRARRACRAGDPVRNALLVPAVRPCRRPAGGLLAVKLYAFPTSPNCLKVRAVAYELGVELDVMELDGFRAAHRAPWLREL